jgi:hypothetical protein
MPNAPKKPHLKMLPSKAGEGKYNVWVEWPDGQEQHVEFASESEAKSWIENDFEAWLKKHPNNQ